MDSVGAYEAKTHLPRLLRRVMDGESVTITRHGRPVARLVPVEEDERTRAYEAARRIRESRRRLKNKASLEELLETIHEGHRY
ncbi:type II toxin-antitoxin system Phd/YefM family antitoxin [Candidatus Palauibacter sp.]|uniref:type II toxin-antitoxin system Phd/YefM family antitoxin n=1 Tax=Candidatus Palauibacter sp. TaxID=3101350 RepID=UPI003B516077